MAKRIPFGTKIHFEPWAWVVLTKLNDGIRAEIYNDYGDYLINGQTRNNTGHQNLYINSWNASYAKSRARAYWSRYF